MQSTVSSGFLSFANGTRMHSCSANTLSSTVGLSKILETLMDAGIKQHAQSALVLESVVSAVLLLRLSRISSDIGVFRVF